jgi:hypothetical protein
MSRSIKLALCLALLLLCYATQGVATTYTFGDYYHEWTGYETALNYTDTWGNPHLESAQIVTRANGSLNTISIFLTKTMVLVFSIAAILTLSLSTVPG